MMGSTHVDADRMAAVIELLARLVGALELREASDPDSPPWAAEQEIRRLEHEITLCLHNEAWMDIGDASDRPPRDADRRVRRLEMTRPQGVLDG